MFAELGLIPSRGFMREGKTNGAVDESSIGLPAFGAEEELANLLFALEAFIKSFREVAVAC
jgi:hypothetical protein